MVRITVITLSIATALLLGACSSPEPVPAPPETAEEQPETELEPGPVEPSAATCVLLEGIDVAALLGEDPGAPEEGNGVCKIEPADAASPASLVLQVVDGANGATFYERDRDLLGVSSEIADLGDEAYFAGKRVNVLVRGTYVYLQVLRDPAGGAGQVDDAELVDATATVLANGEW